MFPSKLSPQVGINPTTFARWGRHCSPEAIQAQLVKLQSLNINNLNIDYELKNRDICDLEIDQIHSLKLLHNPHIRAAEEIMSHGTSWAESRPDLQTLPLNRLSKIPRVSLLNSQLE
jgi:hypothetical protein